MDAKILAKTSVVFFGSIYVCFLLQTAVFAHFDMAGITPDFLLVLTVAFGYLKGRRGGILMGFCCGMLLDVFIGGYFGMHALLLMYLGYMNGVIRVFYFGDDIKFPLLLMALSDVLYGLLIFTILFLLRERSDLLFYLQNVILPETVYSVIVGMPVYTLLKYLLGWSDKQEKRATHSSV